MTKNVVKLASRGTIRQEAAAWLARVDGGQLSAGDIDALRAWVDSNPRHLEALREAAGVWNSMDSLSRLAGLFPMEERDDAVATGQRGRTQWRYAIAATALVATFLGSWVALDPVDEALYRTDIGQQQVHTLKDGSQLTLNTDTVVDVRLDRRERAIRLLDGEAYFKVAKNPDKPFVVRAGQGTVTAVGTEFSVQVEHGEVHVVVYEGTVKVATDTPEDNVGNTGALTLHHRGMARYSDSIEATDYLDSGALNQALAWKSGRWIFNGETLSDAVKEINRYTKTKLYISDPAIANLRIGGYFKIGDVDSLLAALHSTFGIAVTHTDNQILLSAG